MCVKAIYTFIIQKVTCKAQRQNVTMCCGLNLKAEQLRPQSTFKVAVIEEVTGVWRC